MPLNAESAHPTHDALLIASFAAGDALAPDRTIAERRIRECPDCRALHDDLVALRTATAMLPRAASAPRDFRLTAEQAARLRGGPWWRRMARALIAPRGIGRPLATAFTTLGLVGLLIGSLPIAGLPLAGFATDRSSLEVTSNQGAGSGGAPAPEANPSDAYTQYGPGDGIGGVRGEPQQPQVTDGPPRVKDDGAGGEAEVPTVARDVSEPNQVSPVYALAVVFLLVGVALFGFRRLGRRLT
jgi:hypothetical protein